MMRASAFVAVAVTGLAGAVLAQEPPVKRGVQVFETVTPQIINIDMSKLQAPRKWQPGDPIKEIPRRSTRKTTPVAPPPPMLDPLLGEGRVAGRGPGATIFNFEGPGFSGVTPPDTVGDVGPNHYVQMINGQFGTEVQVYSKVNPPGLLGAFILDNITSTPPCDLGLGDPIVLYDQFADRWLLSEFSSSGNRLCVYVSQTPNPLSGGWFLYAFQAPGFPDYPKYGVWPDAYYVGTNESSPALYALNRTAMLAGAPATGLRFTTPALSGFPFQMLPPADADGVTPPPAGAPAVFLRHKDSESHGSPGAADTIELFQFHADFATPANSTLTGPISIPIAEFDSNLCGLSSFSCIPQPSGANPLDPLREVVMHRPQYRNRGTHQTIVGSFATDVTGTDRAAVRWFELRNTGSAWTLFQQGTTASPDATNRWMSSVAMDGAGNIGLAYNVSSGPALSVFPGLRYTGRESTDAAGTLAAEQTIVSGSASNNNIRYGDYASLNVDPSDECTFWFTGEYNRSDAPTGVGTWSTRIAGFKFASCGGPPPTIAINDVAVTEGNSGSTNATFTVSLSGTFSSTVTVNYATANQTATAGLDYTASSGVVTFPPGTVTQPVSIPVLGDTIDEPNETFLVNLTGPVNGTLADGQGVGTINDDDAVPAISIDDVAVAEGNAGTVNAVFMASLSSPSGNTVTVNFATANGTATAGSDYTAASGPVSFAPGITTQPITVTVSGDTTAEANETFQVNLTGPSNATIADAQGVGTINNDDLPGGVVPEAELSHGFRLVADLAAVGGVADTDTYRLSQKPRSSYEILVDGTSGDVFPIALERLDGTNTVVQTATPVGVGPSRSLRFINGTAASVEGDTIRVTSGGCSTTCGADDVYRLRSYETTGAIPRFNNSGSQITVLVLQNPTDATVSGTAYLWSSAGALVGQQAFSLAAKQLFVLNTSAVAPGVGGSITVVHDGRYGGLVGKTVALEPATGFSFDSPMVPRVR